MSFRMFSYFCQLSSYRDKPYYPKDLVDYARSQYTSLDQQGNTMIKELR